MSKVKLKVVTPKMVGKLAVASSKVRFWKEMGGCPEEFAKIHKQELRDASLVICETIQGNQDDAISLDVFESMSPLMRRLAMLYLVKGINTEFADMPL